MPVYQPKYASDLRMSGEYRHPFVDRAGEDDIDPQPYSDLALTANERNMIALSAALRAKPNWWVKIQDATIREKWREEALNAPASYGELSLNEAEVQYVLDEVTWYATQRDDVTGIEQSIFHRIWQSDKLVDETLQAALLQGVAVLENVPDDRKDWHPRSNGQVLDLVHPSLYCIVYGRTMVYEGSDEKLSDLPPAYDVDNLCGDACRFLSDQFSWLPTDFSISSDGTSAKALAYINNLSRRRHPMLYPIIEQLVARFVPLWERVLGETQMGEEHNLPSRIGADAEQQGYEWVLKDGFTEDELTDDDWEDREKFNLVLPSVISPFEPYEIKDPVSLRDRNIQVIVKLANIYLTPEKPSYPGGSWHVEGMMNEAIISTGIYYYDEQNVSQSSLAFRMGVHAPMVRVEQSDYKAAKAVFGISLDDPLNQVLGSVVTKQGRCLAFPNLYQHKVRPFELVDKSQPGHRKILALFLVDPALESPRLSTSDIAPQQQDEVCALLHDVASQLGAGGHPAQRKGLGKLPNEVLDMIVDQADFVMTRREAEEYRLRLMDERGIMVGENTELMFAAPFNMCEH
ncbi:hypothetical protein PHLGIDRAFT_110570 [Phlebiopsis gigantea 11061_1 CR5-6]|uniref:Uncharacterized protein n=1 Tax=Phlebiopsis gigantea (strain 11061_1 CR5-6) TaxID=745531 RepID=A0A0C3PE38_PHLG1|nr:hypothetical protein PHLGIDRAFT_110570 [Phlebiopsis gigantea 11061_1 CR5-6]